MRIFSIFLRWISTPTLIHGVVLGVLLSIILGLTWQLELARMVTAIMLACAALLCIGVIIGTNASNRQFLRDESQKESRIAQSLGNITASFIKGNPERREQAVRMLAVDIQTVSGKILSGVFRLLAISRLFALVGVIASFSIFLATYLQVDRLDKQNTIFEKQQDFFKTQAELENILQENQQQITQLHADAANVQARVAVFSVVSAIDPNDASQTSIALAQLATMGSEATDLLYELAHYDSPASSGARSALARTKHKHTPSESEAILSLFIEKFLEYLVNVYTDESLTYSDLTLNYDKTNEYNKASELHLISRQLARYAKKVASDSPTSLPENLSDISLTNFYLAVSNTFGWENVYSSDASHLFLAIASADEWVSKTCDAVSGLTEKEVGMGMRPKPIGKSISGLVLATNEWGEEAAIWNWSSQLTSKFAENRQPGFVYQNEILSSDRYNVIRTQMKKRCGSQAKQSQ